jgi:glycosyltransferase involved in cell wall biosynthesis
MSRSKREPTPTSRIEVAQVVTRFIAGAGGVALRGVLPLDPERFHVTFVTGEVGPLADLAAAAGHEVLVEPSLVPTLSVHDDRVALSRLRRLFLARQFDVVHTHSAKAGAVGRWAAHRAGTPLIVHTYHGFPFHPFQSPARRAAYIGIERQLARVTDVVLAIGTGVATEALRRGLARPETLRTVEPVVDGRVVAQTPTTREAARRVLGLGADVPVVGTVGRLDFQKAPEHFVEALAALRRQDAVGVWIGGGPLLDRTRQHAGRLGVAHRLRLVGERTDVADLLPAFDVFAMSSRYEGLPCAVVEAMRCGLPVVATAVNSVPDLVVPGVSGLLVPPAAPRTLAAAIDRLLEAPATAHRLAGEGQRRAGAAYDATTLSTLLDQVYSEGLVREPFRQPSLARVR